MDDRMELEIVRTVELLKASMPRKETRPQRIDLLRVAVGSISKLYLTGVFFAVLLLDIAFVSEASNSSLVVFCTSPFPMLLIFHKYILSVSEAQRELESTLRFSYAEVMGAKMFVVSTYTLVYLALLALSMSSLHGGSFIQLALYGAVPSLFVSGTVLILAGVLRNFNGISEMAFGLWIFAVFVVIKDNERDIWWGLDTADFGVLCMAGLAVLAVGYTLFMKRRIKYEAFA